MNPGYSHKTYLLVMLCCIFTVQQKVFAQKVQWSVPQKVTNQAYITESLGENKEGVFIIKKTNRNQPHDIVVERYSDDMRKMISKVFLTRRNENFIRLVLDTAGLKMFYANIDKDKKLMDIRMKTISFALGEYGTDTSLFTVDGNNYEQAMITAYKMKMSPYVLFTYTNDKSDYAASYEYVLVDKDYKKVSVGNFNIGTVAKSSIEQVSFNGERFGLLVREDNKQKQNRQGYQFYIYDGRFGDVDLTRNNLFTDSVTVTEGILKTDFKNNNMVFAGLYATKDSSYVKGCYIWKRDLTSQKLYTGFKPFNTDVIVDMLGRRNKVQGILNLRAGDMTFRSDGGMILTSEEYQETHESVTDVNAYGVVQPSVRNFYYYQNLLVLSINPEGGIDWHTVIRKDQVTVNDNGTYSSYVVCATPDKLVYIYNDLSRKNWTLNVTEVNDKGVAANSILVRPQNYDGRMVPQYGDQISYNQFLVPGVTARGIVLMKVTYQ